VEWKNEGGYRVTDDRSAIDLDVVHRWLSEDAYWALGRSRAVVARSVSESLTLGLFDRVEPAAELVSRAVEAARALAASAAYARVKAQLRAATNARLAHIVAAEDDPLLEGWL